MWAQLVRALMAPLVTACVLTPKSCGVDEASVDGREVVKAMMPAQVVRSLEASRYVVFVMGLASRSHAKPFISVTNELAKRGHELAFASVFDQNYDFVSGAAFSRFIKLKSTFEYFNTTKNSKEARKRAQESIVNNKKWQFGGHHGLGYRANFIGMINEFYEGEYLSMKEEFRVRRPDLLVCDFPEIACIDFAKTAKIPFVIISVMSNFYLHTEMPWFLPHTPSGHTPLSMSYWQRVENFFLGRFYLWYHLWTPLTELNGIRHRVGVIPTYELSCCKRTHILVYSYPGFEVPRYTSPFIHLLGPIFQREKGEMTFELKNWLGSIAARHEESVVYISFGTMATFDVSTVRSIIAGVLFQSFCRRYRQVSNETFPPLTDLKQNVHLLWSTANNKINPAEVLPANVFADLAAYHIKIVRWLPQVKVLNHPAVKLFVTHGGTESVHESCLAGKPILVLPGFGDQVVAGLRAQERGFGSAIGHGLSNERTAYEACVKSQHLLHAYNSHPTFRENLEKMSKIVHFNSQRFQNGADVIELEMNAGSDHLHLLEDEWPLYRLYDLDIIVPIFLAIWLVLFIKRRRASADTHN